ncbi:hypothetical protein [Hansschlegelia plantiphila]|uniref:Uncharacterized protein n=1 Tax=Hansschlegelia plantiphila TaxID=374655 RepID=A0A9W6J4R2_9HYPH|nr:hypothetical protein [Hansschlegelia plantiphila]GLK69248.1 hypothetical protein GCM10008179_28860 [Hansschlegelia plantiphila]
MTDGNRSTRLTEVIDDASSSAGYKFDLFDAKANEIVKVFATRDALFQAVAIAQADRPFDLVLIDAANAKFDKGGFEEDGLILLEKGDVSV